MTKIILDPCTLSLEFPKASDTNYYQVRILAQVHEYDVRSATLTVGKISTIPQIHTTIKLDDEEDDTDDSSVLKIKLVHIIDLLDLEMITRGSIVNITGSYNGTELIPNDCYILPIDPFLSEFNVSMLVDYSQLKVPETYL